MTIKENCSEEAIEEMRRETIWAICLKMQGVVPEKLVVLKDIQNEGPDECLQGFGLYEEKVNLGPNIFGWRPFKKAHHRQLCYLDVRGSMRKIFFTVTDKRFQMMARTEADNLAKRFKAITKEEVTVEITREYV